MTAYSTIKPGVLENKGNDYEQKLINSYNTVVLRIDNVKETDAVKEYEKSLTQMAAIRKQVYSDCEVLGIK